MSSRSRRAGNQRTIVTLVTHPSTTGLDTPEEHGLLDPPRNDGQQKGIQMLTRISSNGQLTIPKSIRDALQFKSGDQFQARVEDGKIILERVTDEFDSILEKARKQAKEAGMTKVDVSKAIAKVRSKK